MGYQACFNRKVRLVELINSECTGNPDCLAEKLGVSRRTVFRYLDELKDSGAKITFSIQLDSYVFEEEFNFFEAFFSGAIK